MSKPLTFLELLDYRSCTSGEAANKRRDLCETHKEAMHIDQKSYQMGEAYAFNAARELADRELRRLCNLFQNGALQISDFGVHL